jgi:hypothetical protein
MLKSRTALCTSSDGCVFPPSLVPSSAPVSPTKRSTTATARSIFLAALDASNTDSGTQAASTLNAASAKQWRYGYRPSVRAVAISMASDDQNPLNVARAGLQQAHEAFRFRREGFPEMSLTQACSEGQFTGSFVTGTSSTTFTERMTPVFTGVPYEGHEYRGKELIALAQSFSNSGQAEPSFAVSVEEIVRSGVLDEGLADQVFVLMGATSEMGPAQTLLDLGATVVALARPASKRDPDKWKRLLHKAEVSPGTMLFPTRSSDASVSGAGADALMDTPEIINWLVELFKSHPLVTNKTLHMYSGIYLDGGMFVRASMSMEMIVSECTKRLPNHKLPALLYIDTPSHAHIVAKETYHGHLKQQQQAPVLMKIGAMLGMIKNPTVVLSPGDKENIVVMDFLATQQGPNYALAKQLQRWRAIWSRHSTVLLFPDQKGRDVPKAKQLVSLTLGPAAKTESVMHSKTMAMVMNTIDQVKPNVAHEPETVQSLMALIMIRDLTSRDAMGNPENVEEEVRGTNAKLNFLVENAWHGGYWRSPYAMDSVGMYCIVSNYMKTFVLPLVFLVLVMLKLYSMFVE